MWLLLAPLSFAFFFHLQLLLLSLLGRRDRCDGSLIYIAK